MVIVAAMVAGTARFHTRLCRSQRKRSYWKHGYSLNNITFFSLFYLFLRFYIIVLSFAWNEINGATPVEQIFYELINQVFSRKIRTEGFKTQEQLKSETVAEVKEILKAKNYEWL